MYRVLTLALVLLSTLALAQKAPTGTVNVLTRQNDNQHTGQNLQETILTPTNVNSGSFGKIFSYPVDGQIYAEPLYVQNLTMAQGGVHNVVFVATEYDSIYAFDADSVDHQSGAALAHKLPEPAQRCTGTVLARIRHLPVVPNRGNHFDAGD